MFAWFQKVSKIAPWMRVGRRKLTYSDCISVLSPIPSPHPELGHAMKVHVRSAVRILLLLRRSWSFLFLKEGQQFIQIQQKFFSG